MGGAKPINPLYGPGVAVATGNNGPPQGGGAVYVDIMAKCALFKGLE